MKKILIFLIAFLIPVVVFAAPTTNYFRDIAPETTNTYNSGTPSNFWRSVYSGTSTASSFVASSTTATSTFNGNLKLSGRLIDSNNASGTSGMVLQSTGSAIRWVATSSVNSNPSFDGPGTLQFASTTSGQFFSTSTLKYDTTTGFLGVGSSTPVAKLSVVGKINQNGSYAKFGSSEPLATCDIGTCMELWGDDNTTNGVQMGIGNRNAGTAAYSFLFFNNDLADSSVTKFAGLGLNSSTYSDTTFGTGLATPNQYILQNTMGPISTITSTSSTNGYINFLTGGSASSNERMRITSTGNVGIGTTAPSEKLSVAGNALITGLVTASSFTATSTTASVFPNASTTALTVSTTAYLPGSGIWNSSGNVGIGTVAPDQLLSLNKNTGNTYISLRTGGSSKAFIGISDAVDSPVVGMTAGDLGLRVQANDMFFSGDSGTTGQMVIKASGDIGIGTTSPSAKLAITGTSGSTTDLFAIASSTNARLFTVTSAGNVGLGTTAPLGNLHISGTSVVASWMSDTAAGTDAKNWAWQVGSGIGTNILRLRAVNDANSNGINPLVFTRTGIASVVTDISAGRVGMGASPNAGNASLELYNTSASLIGQLIKASPSQSANILQFQNSSATVLGGVTALGRLYFGSSHDGLGGLEINGSTQYGIFMSSALTGGTTGLGVYANQTYASDVTSQGTSFRSSPSTAAASFTVTNLRHFQATNASIGSGSAITNQYGVDIGALSGASNNYGIASAVASGATNYNIYANGTAQNYFAGNVGIGSTTPSAKLAITGTAGTPTTPIFVVASSTNARVFSVDGYGREVMGSSTAGRATLASGAATVNTTAIIDSNTLISLTLQNCSSCGSVYINSTSSSSFTIGSTNVLDASVVAWRIYQKSN